MGRGLENSTRRGHSLALQSFNRASISIGKVAKWTLASVILKITDLKARSRVSTIALKFETN